MFMSGNVSLYLSALLATCRLAFVVIVYLAIGSAYQFFVKKERGIRILPNYDFWKTFLMLVLVSSGVCVCMCESLRLSNLTLPIRVNHSSSPPPQQEGCKFFLDIITCFQFNGQVKKAPTVGKVDYDKI